MSILAEIRTKYNILSPTQKKIADVILNSGDKVVLMSISELAEKCETSETTIMRFLRKMGYDSYQVFRVRIAQEFSDKTPRAIYEEIKPDDSIESIKNKVIQSTINSINDLERLIDGELLNDVVNMMKNAGRIYFFGVGASSAIALDAFHKFLRLGLNVYYCSDSHIMSIIGAHTTNSDLIFAISHSGESKEILDAVELAKENGTKVISITSYKNSSLTKLSEKVILSSTNETKYRSDAMVSRIIQLAIIDILYVALVLRLGPDSIDKVNKSRLAVAKKKL
ncbi:MurR/RpiR family transcriptional regulator [Thermovenabulum gondwanense]|uniref:Putative HTH-type transcriptional regulator YbbH n=1 Tax=Thermovenabulum gondwanense TaxID=520767 RepID=A0A161PY35_9FIRM|nr:MurR/RpiR family transcriptional regulator [Thermovenabulum gondwanense]KYO66914.1 putative HTH-type transcriptional regulator YbbH [Thermovenabulum gondwanense]